jgi:hypothetical protein
MKRVAWLLMGSLLGCAEQDLMGSVTIDGPSDLLFNQGEASVTVIVHDSSGAMRHRTVSKGWGARFGVDVPPDGMVTIQVHSPVSPSDSAYTWTHVQPGDHLFHLGATPKFAERKLRIVVPELPGATRYLLEVLCLDPNYGGLINDNSLIGVFDVSVDCLESDPGIVAAVVATTGDGVSAAIAPNVPLQPNGVTLAALGPYVPSSSATTVIFQNVSAFQGGISSLETDIALASNGLLSYASAVGDVSTVGPVATPSAQGYVFVTLATAAGVWPHSSLWLQRSFSIIPSSLQIDAHTDLLPTIAAAIDANPDRPTITWTTAAAVPETAAYASVTANVGELRWTVEVPPQPGAVTFPELPTDLRGRGSTLQRVQLVEASDLGGYDSARNARVYAFPHTNSLRLSRTDYRPQGPFGNAPVPWRMQTPTGR